MSRAILPVVALTVLIGGCAALERGRAPATEVVQATPVEETVAEVDPKAGGFEPVYAAAADREAVTFRVNSNGCTTKRDFAVDVRRIGNDATVTLRRLRPDDCRNVQPENVEVKFAFDELGLRREDAIRFSNPFAGS